jgi:hypothetical protein
MQRVKALTAKVEKADPKRVGLFCAYMVLAPLAIVGLVTNKLFPFLVGDNLPTAGSNKGE